MPSIDMLVKVADFFKVSTDYLLGRSNQDVLSLEGLTNEQSAHIRMLVSDLLVANNN